MKQSLDRESARAIAEDFLERTKSLYARVEVAGSIRRKEVVVHDVDFAVIPRGHDFNSWRDAVKRCVESIGGQVISFGEVMSNFDYRGTQVNLFICPSTESWGATLMWATGPKGHTIGMTIKARDKGLILDSQGIWTRKEPRRLIVARTEKAVGRVLGWKYKPPEERGKGAKKETAFY